MYSSCHLCDILLTLHKALVNVVRTWVPTMSDVWVEPMFKTIRHRARDTLSGESGDGESGVSVINTHGGAEIIPYSECKTDIEMYKIYNFKTSALRGGSANDGQGKLLRQSFSKISLALAKRQLRGACLRGSPEATTRSWWVAWEPLMEHLLTSVDGKNSNTGVAPRSLCMMRSDVPKTCPPPRAHGRHLATSP
jgi:hypothetical protein